MEKYELALAVTKNGLATLTHLLEKVETHIKEKEITEDSLLSASLSPDMFAFARQIQIATDDARRNLLLLAGKEHIKMDDTEKTVVELKERVKKTLEVIASLKKEDFEGADERHISLYWMGDKYVEGKDFVEEFFFLNFFFHVVTAYDILRKEGVAIGKMDFITKFTMKSNA